MNQLRTWALGAEGELEHPPRLIDVTMNVAHERRVMLDT